MNTAKIEPDSLECNFTSIRQATRHVTRFYDACLAESGLRVTQYAILAMLAKRGTMTIAAMADILIVDRATMGHNLRPLERDGLLTIQVGTVDRREREVGLTETGKQKEKDTKVLWQVAQRYFEQEFGLEDALLMRKLMYRIARMGLVEPNGKLSMDSAHD